MQAVMEKKSSQAIHRDVAEEVARQLRTDDAVQVSKVAKATGKDQRTVQHHLVLMEAAGSVIFVDREKRLVSSLENLERLVRDAVRAPWQAAAHGVLRQVWDNDADERWNNV